MTSATLFDDDFAEASIEAISLAAVRSTPTLASTAAASAQNLTDETVFPAPSSNRSVIRRALSSLSASRTKSNVRGMSFVSSPAIGAVAAATAREGNQSMNGASFRRAVVDGVGEVKLTPLGEWYRDILALPHNALRAEVGDLRKMMEVVASGGTGFGAGIGIFGRVEMMGIWWSGFEAFLGEWFGFEDEVLLPWIFRGDGGGEKRELREKMKGHAAFVMELGMEVGNVFVLFEGGGGVDVVPLLVRVVGEFVRGFLSFLEMEEGVLPGLIRSGRRRDEAFNVCRLMCRRVDVVLLTRWISSRRERAGVRRLYMNPASWIGHWARRKRIYSDHLRLVKAVCGWGVGVR